MTLKPAGVFKYNGFWRMDHNVDFNRKDWKVRALQYKACGYKTLTVVRLILATTNISKKQVENLITNFVKRTGTPFRNPTDDGMEAYYRKEMWQRIGKTQDSILEYTDNQPLQGGDYRFVVGVTKEEKKLLNEIRGMK